MIKALKCGKIFILILRVSSGPICTRTQSDQWLACGLHKSLRQNGTETGRVKHNGHWVSGMVTEKLDVPRSFMIKTESGSELRRNRRHLDKSHEDPPACTPPHDDDAPPDRHQPDVETDTVPVPRSDTVSSKTSSITSSGHVVKPPMHS